MLIKKEKENKQMMILSFIGIVLVVLGHTNDQLNLFTKLFPIYSFHMALFVFISGYFYKEKYESNFFGKNGYLLKKVKSFVVPYFVWNVFYGVIIILCHHFNLIEYGDSLSWYSMMVKPWLNGHQFIINLPSWFLLSLFLVNIVYLIINVVLKKIKIHNDYILLVIYLVLALFCIYYSMGHNINIYLLPFLRLGLCMFFYQFGVVYKRIEKVFNFKFYKLLILLLIQLVIIKIDNNLYYEMVHMKFSTKYFVTPILCGITGIIFWSMISQLLVPALKDNKYVNYVSSHTKEIMFHHLFWVFLINTVLFLLIGVLDLSSFDVLKYKHSVFYIYTSGVPQLALFYSIVALNMPLVFHYLYEKFVNRKRKKRAEIEL